MLTLVWDLTIKISEEKKYRPQKIAPLAFKCMAWQQATKLEELECQKLYRFRGITNIEEDKLQVIGYKILQ